MDDDFGEPYDAKSQHPKGTFGWAMDQVAAGNEVRRRSWPIEIIPTERGNFVRIWRIAQIPDGILIKGWNAARGSLNVDIEEYYPTEADQSAMDWQFLREISLKDILTRNHSRINSPHRRQEIIHPSSNPFWWLIWLSVAILIIAFVVTVMRGHDPTTGKRF